MDSDAEKRAEMPEGSSEILDRRRIEHSNRNLLPYLKPGMAVLDVGCGTGAITQGIAQRVMPGGRVVGLDSSSHLIDRARKFATGKGLPLIFSCMDLFEYAPEEPFDLITAARVLQWLEDPLGTLTYLTGMLKAGGTICILDYNHERIEWDPLPPKPAWVFYQSFLDWRSAAGLNNGIADQLADLFGKVGLTHIQITLEHERFNKGESGFEEHIGIWKKVMETRGKQVVEDGFLKEEDRLLAIEAYSEWMEHSAHSMQLYLLGVSGKWK